MRSNNGWQEESTCTVDKYNNDLPLEKSTDICRYTIAICIATQIDKMFSVCRYSLQ